MHWESDEQSHAIDVYEREANGGMSTQSKKQKNCEKGKMKNKKVKVKKEWGTPKPKDLAASVEFVNMTPKGKMKDMSVEMSAAYQPRAVEAAWQDWWEAEDFFGCTDEKIRNAPPEKRFVMVIPPPNVTGFLHLGHALTNAIQDALTRWHRMKGHATLWVPGTDHAGIATQSVVEKRLLVEENLSRHDLGRDAFIKRVWEWKDQYEARIFTQMRSLGCSVDWKRVYFSMDSNNSRAVLHAFNNLWQDGLIYRATRLINWSCKLKTALSEIEVEYINLDGRTKLAVPGHDPNRKYEFGVLSSFAYPVENSEDQIVVATTRLETMLGDTGVAVHPDDPRYKHIHGKFVVHPLNGRRIPIILDSELVDMEFGTGAVKITPAHDPNDYDCGKRHDLEFINVITDDGAINENGGEFAGMMRYDARIAVEKVLDKKGLFRGKVPNKMNLGLCSRSGDVIEPLVKPQWFINCKGMAARACEAVRSGDLKIIPETREKTWFRWLENIRDWCISRQLWWGHRIPVYFATLEGSDDVDPNSDAGMGHWFAGLSEEDAKQKAAKKFCVDVSRVTVRQDEDVLDTWFSAGLFPFSVFGWPEKTPDFSRFYPTDMLETGFDILFFWVARMVMMGQQLTGKLPFKCVYLHSMVRDKYGRKMSKSLGNVVDPEEIVRGCTLESLFKKLEAGNLPAKEVEKAKKGQQLDFPAGIPECGGDALRFGLLSYMNQAGDINLDINRLVGYRNFCNKIWNATRFAMTNLGPHFHPSKNMEIFVLNNPHIAKRDLFILSRLNRSIIDANTALETTTLGDLTSSLYSFWLNDLCDVYLELIKPVMAADVSTPQNRAAKEAAQQTLYMCLDYGLRLLHPVMPFVTEELWQRLPGGHEEKSITISTYPEPIAKWENEAVENDMELMKDVIHAGRSVRAEYGLLNNVRPQYFIQCDTENVHNVVRAQSVDFQTLAKAGEVVCLLHEDPPSGCAMHSLNNDLRLYVQLKGLVDFDNEIKKLEKKMSKLAPFITALETKLCIENYETKVPEAIRAKDAERIQSLRSESTQLSKAIEAFKRMK